MICFIYPNPGCIIDGLGEMLTSIGSQLLNSLVVWFVLAIIVIAQLDRAGITTTYNKPLDSINQPVHP